MKKTKKITTLMLALVLAISMVLGTTTASAALPSYGEEYQNQPATSYNQIFDDVAKSHWAFSYIMEMNARGVLSGYPNGNFYPENTITRAEFAKVMCLAGGVYVSPVYETSYNDVNSSDWFAPYVEAGKYYLSGYVSDGQKLYMPNANALREDIAVALVKLKGYDTSIYDESILKAMFTDWQSISEGARRYVSVAVENGLISGYEDDTFRGQNTITRAEAATLLWRAYQYGNGNKVFEKEEFDTPVVNEPIVNEPVVDPDDNNNENDDKDDDKDEDEEAEAIPELELSLSVNKLSMTVDEGDTAEIKVTVKSNIEGEYVPEVSGDTDILSGAPDVSNKGNSTVCEYEAEELMAGKYELKFSIEDASETHTETIKITVKEPEPEYTYEMDTIIDNIKDVWEIMATDKGFVYWTGYRNENTGYGEATLYEVNKDSLEASPIFCTEDLEYWGKKELSREEQAKLHTAVYGIGFNQNDSCIYAFLNQMGSYYLYNVTDACVDKELYFSTAYSGEDAIHMYAPSQQSDYEITFDNDNNLYINGNLIVGDTSKTMGLISDYITFLLDGTLCDASGAGWIDYYDIRTGAWKEIDYYIGKFARVVCANNKYAFLVAENSNELYAVDVNGDSQLVYSINDIDNVDKKVIKLKNMVREQSAADNDGTIYFYDADYDSIRCIREK